MSLNFVLAFVCAAALCCAQTDATSSSGIPAKEVPASPPSIQPQSNQATANPSPAASAAQTEPQAPAAGQLPPARKTAAQPKSAAGKPDSDSTYRSYVIGPLDVLTIKIWNQPNLSGAVSVGPDGMLSMPLIGEVKAAGLTQKQLRDLITERLKECCVNNPEGEVDVAIGKINSKRYYVYGGVLRAGEFPLDRDMTVMDALSNVGGFKDFANKKKIYILRGTQRFNFNFDKRQQG